MTNKILDDESKHKLIIEELQNFYFKIAQIGFPIERRDLMDNIALNLIGKSIIFLGDPNLARHNDVKKERAKKLFFEIAELTKSGIISQLRTEGIRE